MRDSTTNQFTELQATGGGLSVAITPGAVAQSAKFVLSGLPARNGDMYNYLVRLGGHTNIVVDPDAAGSAINADKLSKVNQSHEVQCATFGVVFPHKHTQGPIAYHLIQVVGLGYQYPQSARLQIPASTDTDVTIDIFTELPIAYECFAKAHESAQWLGFYDGGTFETLIDVSTILDGDYAGAVTKTGTNRAHAEWFPSPDQAIGVPVQWRNRQIVGGSSPILKNIGGETSLVGLSPGSGLAGLWWMTDATGIGMGGPDGLDNFLSYGMEWRGQKVIQNLDMLMISQRIHMERRVGPIAGIGTTIMADGAGWPSTMAATTQVDNRPSANSQAMVVPFVSPGRKLETSKVQTVLGDKQIDFTVTAAITSPHQFVSMELMEFTPDKIRELTAQAGFQGRPRRAQLRQGVVNHRGNLRYTRVLYQR